MTGFVDWATAQGVTMTTSNPTFGAVSYTVWARTDRDEMVEYARDGVTLITQTWHPTLQNYMATNGLLGRVSAGSGAIEEVSLSDAGVAAALGVQPLSTERIWASQLPPVANLQGTSDKAWFVFIRRLEVATTPKHVEFYVNAAGVGLTSAEVGFFSTPAPPNKAGQTITKLVATGTVDDMTTIGVKRNTSAFATSIPAGTYLWAGFHAIFSATMPTLATLGRDYSQGRILETAAAGALTGAGPWTGALCAVPASSLTGVCPELRVVLD